MTTNSALPSQPAGKPARNTSETISLPPTPVRRSNRQTFVDLVRGFALFGILLVNLEYIRQPSAVGWADYRSNIDLLGRWIVIALGQTKIHPLFALLFGYGLSLQMKRTTNGLAGRYRRRMIALIVMGAAHGILR